MGCSEAGLKTGKPAWSRAYLLMLEKDDIYSVSVGNERTTEDVVRMARKIWVKGPTLDFLYVLTRVIE
jgi:hypothetical protein